MRIAAVTYAERHHVNLSNYEWVEFSAEATVEATDPDESGAVLLDKAEQAVRERLATKLRLASRVGDDDTYAKEWLRALRLNGKRRD